MIKIFIIPHPTKNFNPLYTCPRGEAIVNQGLKNNLEVKIVNSTDDAEYFFDTCATC